MITPKSNAGYSLLELLVALAIITLISVTALPGATGAIERLELKGSARELANELKKLREAALDQQEDIRVTLSTDKARALEFSKRGGWQPAWGIEVRLQSGTSNGPNPQMTMGWDGSVSGAIMLSRGGENLRVRGEAVTGRIIIETMP